ncbi:MAG TPA: LysR family transcriptional regulator [Kribbella sp.]
MTPTQLRAFSAVVRLGSVKAAAVELHVTEAAVSLHVGHLRKELGDKLFNRTASGLAFTPGGLRLASRAAELLGLQDRTILEVSQAGRGRRLMRIAASTLFAEHAAPGLIELFADRADDLDVELSVHHPRDFAALLADRVVDVALGPVPAGLPESLRRVAFLNYRIVVVAGANHPAATVPPRPSQLREQTGCWGRPQSPMARSPRCSRGWTSRRDTSASSKATPPRSRRPSATTESPWPCPRQLPVTCRAGG